MLGPRSAAGHTCGGPLLNRLRRLARHGTSSAIAVPAEARRQFLRGISLRSSLPHASRVPLRLRGRSSAGGRALFANAQALANILLHCFRSAPRRGTWLLRAPPIQRPWAAICPLRTLPSASFCRHLCHSSHFWFKRWYFYLPLEPNLPWVPHTPSRNTARATPRHPGAHSGGQLRNLGR